MSPNPPAAGPDPDLADARRNLLRTAGVADDVRYVAAGNALEVLREVTAGQGSTRADRS